ncbi:MULTISPECIES: MarR family winged helix-turn-helix transcriptional regulator [unclassified Variovorax]|uniref:MarR family winged helix-turn-helix transcriptional regulator n=1 Tax=unclassified Variovorax TaxID=663243 RepID=UPI001BD3C626|nr:MULTISPECIES: MarR family winged helix-turn-helix transcriptional regulator [unclassified Variovorax]
MELEFEPAVLDCVSEEAARLELGLHLCLQFIRTLSRRCDDALAENGMGRAHHRVLFLATRDVRLTVGEMGALLGISNQALSQVLKRLFSQGYLTQEVDPDDRRKRVILPTPQSFELMRRLDDLQKDIFNRGFHHVGAKGTVTFFRTLAAMLEPESAQVLTVYAGRLDALGQDCLLKTISGVARSKPHSRRKTTPKA